MSKQLIMSQAKLADNAECKVLYNKAKDISRVKLKILQWKNE